MNHSPEPDNPTPTKPLPDLPDEPMPMPMPGDPTGAGTMTDSEGFKDAMPDRGPTPAEEAAADRALDDVDVDAVAEEYQHMTALGARVHGEGEIEPDPS